MKRNWNKRGSVTIEASLWIPIVFIIFGGFIIFTVRSAVTAEKQAEAYYQDWKKEQEKQCRSEACRLYDLLAEEVEKITDRLLPDERGAAE